MVGLLPLKEAIGVRIPGPQQIKCYNTYMNKLGINSVIFILFFGIALIEAFQKQNWLEAVLFAALGILSLRADLKKS